MSNQLQKTPPHHHSLSPEQETVIFSHTDYEELAEVYERIFPDNGLSCKFVRQFREKYLKEAAKILVDSHISFDQLTHPHNTQYSFVYGHFTARETDSLIQSKKDTSGKTTYIWDIPNGFFKGLTPELYSEYYGNTLEKLVRKVVTTPEANILEPLHTEDPNRHVSLR